MHNNPVDMSTTLLTGSSINHSASHLSAVTPTIADMASVEGEPTGSHAPHVNTRHAVHSFVTSASHGSRVAAMAIGPGLQSLVIAAMLATAYDSPQVDNTPALEGTPQNAVGHSCSPQSAINKFLLADPHIHDVLRPQYQPVSDAAVLHLKGRRITARLFGYTKHLCHAARADTQRHAVLVVYGDARTVLQTSALMASPKGQVRIDRSTEQLLQTLEESVVCKPEFLFGVATADILWDYVGTKNIPSPTDLAALLAQTTSLCYQGAFVCEVGVRKNAVEGVQRLSSPLSRGGLGMQVVLTSNTRTTQQLQHLLLRRCHHAFTGKVEIVAPDALGRWLTDGSSTFDEENSIVGFAAGSVGGGAHDVSQSLKALDGWCRRRTSRCFSSGVVFCGHSCNAAIGFSLADVAVMVGPQNDLVSHTVLRNGASVSVSRFGIDDIADALLLARNHINQSIATSGTS